MELNKRNTMDAQPTPSHPPRVSWILWALGAYFVVCAALQVGDVLTTQRALALGGYEGNPISSLLLTHFGFTGLALYKAFATCMILVVLPASWYAAHRQHWVMLQVWITLLIGVSILAQASVVIHNLQLIDSLSRHVHHLG